jgi:3-hydroxyisobutyrate dehydrogenase-like beta-hydroxyacid dehydrogenase
MTLERLGFVGLGRMGGPMAGRLLDTGYQLTVYDVSDEALAPLVARGAKRVSSAAEVASAAEIVLTSLPTPPIVESAGIGPGGIVEGSKAEVMLDMSTTGPATAKRIAAGLAAKRIQWVDCPVSGGIKGAVNGTLALMVSCPKETFERVRPILEVFGKIFYIGEMPGLAQVVKLGNNMMAAAAIIVAAEALAMGVKAGVNPRVMNDVLNASTGRNTATTDKVPRSILPGTFDFGFATGLSYKDVRLCVDEAEAMGVPMLAGGMVREILAITNAKYGSHSDFTCLAKLIEEWAGVEIRG